jgi:hypothetical protein
MLRARLDAVVCTDCSYTLGHLENLKGGDSDDRAHEPAEAGLSVS